VIGNDDLEWLPGHIKNTLSFGKKNFQGKEMKCSYCGRRGHLQFFCPILPTEGKGSQYVENLLALPRVDIEQTYMYGRDSCTRAIDKMIELGKNLNQGNDGVTALGKRAGFWKAIGASYSVMSWITKGIKLGTSEPKGSKL